MWFNILQPVCSHSASVAMDGFQTGWAEMVVPACQPWAHLLSHGGGGSMQLLRKDVPGGGSCSCVTPGLPQLSAQIAHNRPQLPRLQHRILTAAAGLSAPQR